ncbi:DUF3572 domain-containing protein [Paenochrobactrum sp. BZR 588]|uniref:DUF3572 domain-containing protein n=1 Tax=Paenochrobactrum TaxID=999488 RepID=UPI0035BBF986
MKTAHNEQAEALAIEALIWLTQEPELMSRFLTLTGIDASAIRNAAREPGFLSGVLQFLLAHEPTLMRFCEATETEPNSVVTAARQLPGGQMSEF